MLHTLATSSLLPNESKNKCVTVQICLLLTVTDLSVTPSLSIYYSLTPPVLLLHLPHQVFFQQVFSPGGWVSPSGHFSIWLSSVLTAARERDFLFCLFLPGEHPLISVTFVCYLLINLPETSHFSVFAAVPPKLQPPPAFGQYFLSFSKRRNKLFFAFFLPEHKTSTTFKSQSWRETWSFSTFPT